MNKALIIALALSQVTPPGIKLRDEGVTKGTIDSLNCTGTGVTCSVAGRAGTIDVSGGGGGGAPTTSTYITQTPSAGLSAEQALSLLSTGVLGSTTGTGVVSTVAPWTNAGALGDAYQFTGTVRAPGFQFSSALGCSGCLLSTGTYQQEVGLMNGQTGTTNAGALLFLNSDGYNTPPTVLSAPNTGAGVVPHKWLRGGEGPTGSARNPSYAYIYANEIKTTNSPSAGNYLRGDGVWANPSTGGYSPGVLQTTGITAGGSCAGQEGALVNDSAAGAWFFCDTGTSTWSASTGYGRVATATSATTLSATLAINKGGTGNTTGNAASANVINSTGAANTFWSQNNTWAQPSFSNLSGTATDAQIGGPYLPRGGTAASTNALNGAIVAVANHTATGTPGATTFYRGDNTWSVPAGTYTLPAASTTLGGVKHAANCSAGNHVNGIGAAGELSCSADSGGGGAPTTSTYWTSTADAGLSAEVNLGGLTTGLLLNTVTAGTAAPSAYGGTSCTNQFPRSLNASGAATCASVDLSADTAATVLPMTKGGTGANLTGTTGGVHYSSSTTVTAQTAGGAAGTILANSSANTPAWLAAGTAGQVLSSRGAAAPVYVGVQSCTSSAATTCTITVARSGCVPVCGLGTAASTWVKGTVSTTTLTCTFSTSGTNTCNCLCP